MPTGLTSTSLDRAPAPSKTFVRGKSGYVPFWPGGFDDPLLQTTEEREAGPSKQRLRTLAPGLSRGLRLPGNAEEEEEEDMMAVEDLHSSAFSNEMVLICLSCIFQG